MAELEAQLRTALTADSNLTAQTSSRIYFRTLPQNPTYPCLVYYYFVNQVHTLSNDSYEALVQIDILGQENDISTVRPLLVSAMENTTTFKALYAGNRILDYNENIDADREILDFNVVYNR